VKKLTTILEPPQQSNERVRNRMGVQPDPHAPPSIGHSKFTPLPSGGRGLDNVKKTMQLKKRIKKGARVQKVTPPKDPSRDPTWTKEGKQGMGMLIESTP
jgi:hypothetical protein